MSKPQRIRSRIMILIYPGINSSAKVMEHLKTKFKIDDDKKWSYIVRQEQTVSGLINTIVFLELNFTPDIYLHKLNLEHNTEIISPSIHSWTDKEFLLRYILTFYGTIDINSEFLTNLSRLEIEENAVVIKLTSNSETLTTENAITDKTITLNKTTVLHPVAMDENAEVLTKEDIKDNVKPTIKPKQTERFNDFYSSFNSVIESSLDNSNKEEILKELERCVRNMVNYRSSYTIPDEMLVRIKECQGKLKIFKKNL